jgi:hypothetical protein
MKADMALSMQLSKSNGTLKLMYRVPPSQVKKKGKKLQCVWRWSFVVCENSVGEEHLPQPFSLYDRIYDVCSTLRNKR